MPALLTEDLDRAEVGDDLAYDVRHSGPVAHVHHPPSHLVGAVLGQPVSHHSRGPASSPIGDGHPGAERQEPAHGGLADAVTCCARQREQRGQRDRGQWRANAGGPRRRYELAGGRHGHESLVPNPHPAVVAPWSRRRRSAAERVEWRSDGRRARTMPTASVHTGVNEKSDGTERTNDARLTIAGLRSPGRSSNEGYSSRITWARGIRRATVRREEGGDRWDKHLHGRGLSPRRAHR